MLRKITLSTLILFVALTGVPAAAQEGDPAQPTIDLFMRTGPGEEYDVITTLAAGTDLVLEARDPTTFWIMVHTADNSLRGWVSACCLARAENVVLYHLPATSEIVGQAAAPPPSAPADSDGAQGDAEPAVSAEPAPQTAGNATTTIGLNMREDPDEDGEVLTVLPRGTALILGDASPDGYWRFARTVDGAAKGWVSTCCLSYTAASGDDDIAQPADEREAELIDKLMRVPVVPGIGGRVYQIFATGQALGNRPNVFSKVGDCMTEFHAFFLPFGVGEYSLGGYSNLQPTVDFFAQTSPRYGSANSFVNESMAAQGGFSASSVVDPLWAKPDHCESGETPLMCEYRLIRPSVAIILFGAVDVHYLPPDDFEGYLRQVIEYSASQGVIPVLNTVPANRDYMWMPLLEFNSVIVDLASEYGIPVINLWRATQPLPDGGTDIDDYLHLSFDGNRWINFDGSEHTWGYDMRNLVTLQTLDAIRRSVLQ